MTVSLQQFGCWFSDFLSPKLATVDGQLRRLIVVDSQLFLEFRSDWHLGFTGQCQHFLWKRVKMIDKSDVKYICIPLLLTAFIWAKWWSCSTSLRCSNSLTFSCFLRIWPEIEAKLMNSTMNFSFYNFYPFANCPRLFPSRVQPNGRTENGKNQQNDTGRSQK